MWNRFGSKTDRAESGTEEEFETAYNSYKTNARPEIMFYFRYPNNTPQNSTDAEQLLKVLKFRDDLSSKIFFQKYADESEFEKKLRDDLVVKIKEMLNNPEKIFYANQESPGKINKVQYVDERKMRGCWDTDEICSSFEPGNNPESHQFKRVRIATTKGYIKKSFAEAEKKDKENEQLKENFVYLIRDPIRPYSTQVGETRSQRNAGNATAIPDLTNLDLGSIKNIYPFLLVEGFKWIRMVLAELSTDPKILQFIHDNDPEYQIRSIAARNPSASSELQKDECIFCKDEFLRKRLLSSDSDKTRMICNDYPYGPYFHYIAFPKNAIHAWEELKLDDILDLNLTIIHFLQDMQSSWNPKPAGAFIGLNSTIRHLVLGTRTLTSAGASIPHIHKQIWGMSPGSNNLGNYLNKLCLTYEKKEGGPIDYLGAYIEYLRLKKMVLYEDAYVVLYVPYGQISIHELQIMMKKPGRYNYLTFTDAEISSISVAETMAIRYLKELRINSFNEIAISLPFDTISTYFRLVICFMTREVDLAVSELNMLFVVDKHPETTRDMLATIKDSIKEEILGEWDKIS